MSMIKAILTITLFIIAIAEQKDNLCFKYLEDIEIFSQIQEQPFYKEYKQYFIGLKQVQKQAQQYCKGLQLWIFQDNLYNEPIEQQERTLDQLIFQLNDVPVYEQYYAFIHESQKLKFKVYNMKIEFIQQDDQQRLLQSNKIASTLQIYTTKLCSNNFFPEIFLNDKFYLKQIVTDSNFTNYYLTKTEVYYIASGLLKKASIEYKQNSIKGQATILLSASLAWSKLTIQVSSALSNSIDGSDSSFTTQATLNYSFWPLGYELKLCQDQMCTKKLEINKIHLNDEIFVEYKNDDFKNYYFTNTTFYFIGNGLHIIKTPLVIDNSEKGKINAFLKIDIVWKNMNIFMKSDLSTNETASQDSYYSTVSAISEQISCILVNADPLSCPTCEEECSINKFNEEGCDPCVDNNMKIIRSMIMILLISFY